MISFFPSADRWHHMARLASAPIVAQTGYKIEVEGRKLGIDVSGNEVGKPKERKDIMESSDVGEDEGEGTGLLGLERFVSICSGRVGPGVGFWVRGTKCSAALRVIPPDGEKEYRSKTTCPLNKIARTCVL